MGTGVADAMIKALSILVEIQLLGKRTERDF